MTEFLSVAVRHDAELVVERSRFIACCTYVETEADFAAFLKEVKRQYTGATHYCTAFELAPGEHIARFSDDGEPSRTAGLPILEVLQGRGLHRTAVVVVRYFGGVKLGTGGLVRAYGDAAALTLDGAQKQRFVPSAAFTLTCPYPLLPSVERALKDADAAVSKQEYGEQVTLSAACPLSAFAPLKETLKELASGKELLENITETLKPYTV